MTGPVMPPRSYAQITIIECESAWGLETLVNQKLKDGWSVRGLVQRIDGTYFVVLEKSFFYEAKP